VKAFLSIAGLFVILAVAAALMPGDEKYAKPTAPPPTEASPEVMQAMVAMVATGAVSRMDHTHSPPWVMVGPIFYQLDYQQRVRMAQDINDYLTRGSGGGVKFEIHDGHSGDRLYTWEYSELKR